MCPDACRARREAAGLSRYDLARVAGLAERTIMQFEERKVRPRPVTLVALRRAFRGLEEAASGGR